MKQHYFTIGLFLSGILLLSSFSNNPPNGRTGAPGEGLCTDCHTPGGSSADGDIVIEDFPSEITANQTYTITVRVSNPNGLAELAGFQMTIQDAAGVGAGTMVNPSDNSVVTDANGKQYFEHNPAVSITDNVTWTVDWTAPDAADGATVQYYAAGNLANGASGNSGDLIVTTNGEGTYGSTSSNNNIAKDKVQVFPNPVSDVLNLYMTNQSLISQVNVRNLSGQIVQTSQANLNQVDVSSLVGGMYLVEVETSTGRYLTKMMKN